MMKRSLVTFSILLAASSASAGAAETVAYTVIVNASRPASLTRQQIADLFLKRASRWPDGTPAVPVDLSVTEPTRQTFSRTMLGRPTEGIVQYWQQQMYAGRGTPPLVKSPEETLEFVKTTAGAIGYVRSGMPIPAGVKEVTLVIPVR